MIRLMNPLSRSTNSLDKATLDRVFIVEGFLEYCRNRGRPSYQQISHLSVDEFWRSLRLAVMGIKLGLVVEGHPADHFQMALFVATWMGASANCLDVLNHGLQESVALSLSIKKKALEKERRRAEDEARAVRRTSSVGSSLDEPRLVTFQCSELCRNNQRRNPSLIW